MCSVDLSEREGSDEAHCEQLEEISVWISVNRQERLRALIGYCLDLFSN